MEIRLLSPSDVEAYGRLRLRALEEEPFAFASSPEDHRAVSPEERARRLEAGPDGFTLGAFADGALVGAVTFVRNVRPKLRHLGGVVAMYVAPEARGRGTARALLTALIARVRGLEGLERLGVSVTGDAARALYRSLGFVTWGVEPQGLRVHGAYANMEHMSLDLRGASLE